MGHIAISTGKNNIRSALEFICEGAKTLNDVLSAHQQLCALKGTPRPSKLVKTAQVMVRRALSCTCLLYTSDAADE